MLMDKDINCRNFKGLFAYLERQYGPQAVETVTDGLTDNPDFQVHENLDPGKLTTVRHHHLIDSAYWVSNAFSLVLLNNVNKVVAGDNPLFTAGIGTVKIGLSKSALFAGKLLGPSALIRQAARINGRFNCTKDVVVSRHEPEFVLIELHYRDGFRVTEDVCNWNLGLYTGLARATGVRRVLASETRCVLRGDSCCEFRLSWRQAGPLKRIARSAMVWMARNDIQQMLDEHETILSERDQLISRLVRSEEKYRTLFEESMEALNLTRDGRVCDVNPAWMELHGYADKSEVVDKDVMDFIHPDDHFILENRRSSWPNTENRVFQIRDKRRDGSTVHVEVYSTPMTISGEAMILATIRDITAIRDAERERENLELRLQRVEKMEAMGTLVGGVAHDLNNILSGIVSYPELLLMQLPDKSPLAGPLSTIHESGKKATAIVQDLLTMARRGVIVKEVVEMNALIAGYLDSPEFERMISFHPLVSIQRKLADDVGNVLGSPVHLNKTVMNLVANAAESMPDGGIVRVATENCFLSRAMSGYENVKPGDYVSLTVSDTGTGIANEDLQQIFEPFYTKKKMGRSGTGLGMSVVWGTVKDHNGYIDVRSKPGQGTTFSLYFPMTGQQPDRQDMPIPTEAWKGNGESILVVDDSREQREIVHHILIEMGYTVDTVSSGEAALEYLKTRPVDLVILDMIMDPGMDGLDTFKQIIILHPDQKTLFASGYWETERIREAQLLGAGALIRKPYSVNTIARAIHGAFVEPETPGHPSISAEGVSVEPEND